MDGIKENKINLNGPFADLDKKISKEDIELFAKLETEIDKQGIKPKDSPEMERKSVGAAAVGNLEDPDAMEKREKQEKQEKKLEEFKNRVHLIFNKFKVRQHADFAKAYKVTSEEEIEIDKELDSLENLFLDKAQSYKMSELDLNDDNLEKEIKSDLLERVESGVFFPGQEPLVSMIKHICAEKIAVESEANSDGLEGNFSKDIMSIHEQFEEQPVEKAGGSLSGTSKEGIISGEIIENEFTIKFNEFGEQIKTKNGLMHYLKSLGNFTVVADDNRRYSFPEYVDGKIGAVFAGEISPDSIEIAVIREKIGEIMGDKKIDDKVDKVEQTPVVVEAGNKIEAEPTLSLKDFYKKYEKYGNIFDKKFFEDSDTENVWMIVKEYDEKTGQVSISGGKGKQKFGLQWISLVALDGYLEKFKKYVAKGSEGTMTRKKAKKKETASDVDLKKQVKDKIGSGKKEKEREKINKEAMEHFSGEYVKFTSNIGDEEKVEWKNSLVEEKKSIIENLARIHLRTLLKEAEGIQADDVEKIIREIMEKTKI